MSLDKPEEVFLLRAEAEGRELFPEGLALEFGLVLLVRRGLELDGRRGFEVRGLDTAVLLTNVVDNEIMRHAVEVG